MKVKVLNPGISTTIQDSGRINGLAFGVPKCGAMDLDLLHFANYLVSNPISSPVLEMTLDGGRYQFEEDCTVAVVGFGNVIEVNGIEESLNTTLSIKVGDQLRIKSSKSSRYAYLAIRGKITSCEEYWGSYSTYEFVSKGGFKGRKLKKGDELNVENSVVQLSNFQLPNLVNQIRICKGPEFGEFSQSDIMRLSDSIYRISLDSNRMGYRLEGDFLTGTSTGNIISSGVIPGTIQVPKSGSPIVLMADSPCTGGYPRIAVLHPDDIGQFAQKLPNEVVKFVWCDL